MYKYACVYMHAPCVYLRVRSCVYDLGNFKLDCFTKK